MGVWSEALESQPCRQCESSMGQKSEQARSTDAEIRSDTIDVG